MKKCWIMGIVGLVLFADCTNVGAQYHSIVWQEKYPVQAGIADGHIYIDKELNPEDYRIHAYTRFSFLDDTIRPFYPKKIRIVKTIANKGYDSSVPRGYASC